MQDISFHGSVLECIAFLSGMKEGQYEIRVFKEKRSLNANSYYWVLVDQIAKVMNLSRDEIHKQMLNDYGTWEKNEDGSNKWVIFPKNEPLPKDGYFYDTGADVSVKGANSGEETGHAYIVIKGSHNYTADEMKRLIDGVIQEAQSLEIETRTPQEIEMMIQQMREK